MRAMTNPRTPGSDAEAGGSEKLDDELSWARMDELKTALQAQVGFTLKASREADALRRDLTAELAAHAETRERLRNTHETWQDAHDALTIARRDLTDTRRKLAEAEAEADVIHADRVRLADALRDTRRKLEGAREALELLVNAIDKASHGRSLMCNGQQEEHDTEECDGDAEEDPAHGLWDAERVARDALDSTGTAGPPVPGEVVASGLTFAAFAEASRTRCVESFHRLVNIDSVPAMMLGFSEEAGEVAGKVRAVLGYTKRKAGVTVADVGHEIADAVQYADLLAQCFGLTLEGVLAEKFNIVSERIGSPVRLAAGPPGEAAAVPGTGDVVWAQVLAFIERRAVALGEAQGPPSSLAGALRDVAWAIRHGYHARQPVVEPPAKEKP